VKRAAPPPRHAGAALVTALVLMLAVLALGVAAARAAIHGERSARFERDRQIALAAAEAALSDAERDVEGASGPGSARAALFAAGPAGFAKGCGKGADDLGLCLAEADGATPAWQAADLLGAGAVVYGSFTGAQMATGQGVLPVRAPRYIIELIPMAGAPPGSGSLYRITAIGFGAREGTQVVLQSFYRKAASTGPAIALPRGRIAWREVANWSELHEAAAN
jgi:Tfp pilus assembly protein PilX